MVATAAKHPLGRLVFSRKRLVELGRWSFVALGAVVALAAVVIALSRRDDVDGSTCS
jgi:hypothetical protein